MEDKDWKRHPWLIGLILFQIVECVILLVVWQPKILGVAQLFYTITPVPTTIVFSMSKPIPPPAPVTVASPATPTPSVSTPTSTPVVKIEPTPTDTTQPITRATAAAAEVTQAFARLARPRLATSYYTRESRLVLAQYFAWYGADGWNDCNISAGDHPLEPYGSDDPNAIAHHIDMARKIGLDGFLLHWFSPGDRTDRNFETLLARSQLLDFYSTIVFSYHIWHGLSNPNQQNIGEAIRYVMDHYSTQPNFLHLEGKPVLFFVDVYRVPTAAGQTPQQFWAAVRDEVDPQRQAWWIAEGLDASYLAVFDGLYVFKITHASSPDDYQKDTHWAEQTRKWGEQTGRSKLWLATISPGWDDLRAGCKADVRIPNQLYRRDREDGALYRATFDAALKSNPDWLLLSSFNEWVEGTYIEPSVLYGDKYLKMTGEFVKTFKAR